jgi:peptide-methionine (S)-S-oxide reductase
VQRPSYEAVCNGDTGHAEVVKLTFDPAQVSLRQILEIFFVVHDPTQRNRQGNDVGTQYRSGIYYTSDGQKQVAEDIIAELTREHAYGKPIVTEVQPLANYWPAEDYHQDFFEKHPTQGYCLAVAAPKVEKFRKTFSELVRG